MDSPELSVPAESLLEHAAWVRQLAAELVRDPAAADDLVQETWLAFLRARPDTERPLRPWLARVLRNAAALRARGGAGRRAREALAARDEGVPSAHELVERAEQQQRLARAVIALDEPYRSTLLLRYYEGLTPSEIARAHDLPPATVRTHLARGRERLRAQLDEEHGGDRRAWIAMLQPLLPQAAPVAGPAPLVAAALAAAAVGATVAVALGVASRMRGDEPAALGEPPPASARAESERVPVAPGGSRVPSLASDAVLGERVVQLVDDAGRALGAYAVRAGERELQSDVAGRITLPASVTELVPIDDARLALDERAEHGRRRLRRISRAPVALPPMGLPQIGDDALVVLPAGPVYRLELSGPARVERARLVARLVGARPSDFGDSGRPQQVAPVRGGSGGFEGPWVRFAATPSGAEDLQVEWRLELGDPAGLWWGSAPVPDVRPGAPIDVELELRSTGVIQGRVDGVSMEHMGGIEITLHATGGDERVVHWTVLEEEGTYSLPWVRPGAYELRARSPLHDSWSSPALVRAGERLVLDVALEPRLPFGSVSGTVTSASNTYDGQLLVFLLDEHERVLEVFPTTWREDELDRRVAPFRFEAVPRGVLRLDVVSLADAVTFRVAPESFEAPCQAIRVTVLDERPSSEWSFEVLDDATGLELDGFEIEVRVDGGPPRRYRSELTSASRREWTLLAGGLRWNRFEGPAPLRRLPDDVQLAWTVRADGYAPVSGSAGAFDVRAAGDRRATARLRAR